MPDTAENQAAYPQSKNQKPGARELSFKLALQITEAFRCIGLFSEFKHEIYQQLLEAIAYKKIGNRSGRSEPRKLKRRPKNYPLLMQPRSNYRSTNA